MISFVKKDVDNGEKATCKQCVWYESGDISIGMCDGCTHPVLYDDDEDIIDEVNNLIIECQLNPRHCCLMEKKNK